MQPHLGYDNGGTCTLGSLLWFPDLAERIAAHLPPNEVPCGMRLVNKATAALFSKEEHKIVDTCKPVPLGAFAERWGRGRARELTLDGRRDLIRCTALSGDLPNLELATDACGLLPPLDCWLAAAQNGHIHICDWLKKRDRPFDKQRGAVALAARHGHRQTCDWLLREAGYPWSEEAVCEGLRRGDLDLANWLLQQRPAEPEAENDNNEHGGGRPELLGGVLAAAAHGFDLSTFRRLLWELLPDATPASEPSDGGNQATVPAALRALALRVGDEPLSEEDLGSVVAGAAGSKTSDWAAKMEWLEAEGYPKTPEATEKAAACKNSALQRLQWLRGRGYPLGEGAIKEAVSRGDMPALQYLLAEGAPSDVEAADLAARNGRLAALQVLHTTGRLVTAEGAAMHAAWGGHLPVLAWLVEESGLGVELHYDIFAQATQSGNVGMLEWLHQRGCPTEPDGKKHWSAVDYAVAGGHEPSIEWLVERGCSIPVGAAVKGHAQGPVAGRGYLAG
ncbi:hypothetical protein GPECTOR_11g286 [Gonium pectorale]|uniref:Ankyrin repeat domain-containing protein n=1 Tax=Gonium pectorale TaxID=33097 RepID=A0A150GPT4_GONPE|nr:hypothetical protein GPECTOR_11g286 [Gonium pectorale]|eukprot:KXZ51847.1 hypothetical protein GPECTOR_11g286 [Gonium pectorale]